MAAKLAFVLTASFLLSGCCEIFGICTSVNVHTAIDPPYQVARQNRTTMDATQFSPAETASVQPSAATTLACLASPNETSR
jgi:hypothetical protein